MIKSGMALYGRIRLKRVFCEECECMAFIIDNLKQCCEQKYLDEPKRFYRMANSFSKRRKAQISLAKLAEMQNNICPYCNKEFGYLYYKRGKIIKTSIVRDHMSPHCFSADNNIKNIIACCDLCNKIKSDLIFENLDSLRSFLEKKRKKKGIEIL